MRCTSRADDTTAFDLLFAVYHLHYLESEQKYKSWRRASDATHQTHTQTQTYTHTMSATIELPVARAPTETATVDVSIESDSECSETPVSPQSSIFTSFEDDEASSTCTSIISTTSEEEEDKSSELSSPTTSSIDFECSSSSPSPSSSDSNCDEPTMYTGRITCIPRHITTENYATPKPDLSKWVRVADLDTLDDYDVRCLTPLALEEAELRSRDLRRYARMAAADLRETYVPLKAHEHPEPRSMLRPSVLKDLGRISRLCTSWTVEEED